MYILDIDMTITDENGSLGRIGGATPYPMASNGI